MADPSKPLLRIGPFGAFDSTTAGPYADPHSGYGTPGVGTSNVDTERQVGAMCSPRGRLALTTLTGTGNIGYLTHINYGGAPERSIVASLTSGTVERYNVTSGTQAVVTSGTAFNSAFQFGDILYTNAGQQIRPASGYKAYWWAGIVFPPVSLSGSVTLTGTGGMTAGTYFYNATQVFRYTDTGTQESPPISSTNIPLAGVVLTGTGFNSLTPIGGGGPWWGTAGDGSTYTTNLYRMSTSQPTWYFVANINSGTTTATGTYVDNSSDAGIASNQQLQFRFPTPMNFYNILAASGNAPPVFKHKERAFIFTLFNSTGLTSGTQCQLWYSDAGIPWSFFAGSQVLLVGDDSDNSTASTSGPVNYGNLLNDAPLGGVSLASVGILHKRRSIWILYGDDPSTFLPRKMTGVGTVSSGSITVCGADGDIDAWLSEDGPYLTDGTTLKYIGEPVREYLAAIPQTDWVKSEGWYANRTWYLSFPDTGVTLRYYLPKGKWLAPLPYATNAAYAIPSESASLGTARLQEIVGAEPGTKKLDYWANTDALDLGAAFICTWQSPLTDSGAPGVTKAYQWITVNAPLQPAGVILSATLTIDQSGSKTYTWSFDLSQGPTLIATVPPDFTGYMAQLTLSASTANVAGSVPLVIYSAEVHGSIERNLVASQAGVS